MADVHWDAIAKVAGTLLAVPFGMWLQTKLKGPKLLARYGHSAATRCTAPDGSTYTVNTHTVIVKNAGTEKATNVRIHHAVLPSFSVYPPVPYTEEVLPEGQKDIVLATMPPGQELTISYVYFPPLTFRGVTLGVWSDAGAAEVHSTGLQREYSKWLVVLASFLALIGASAVLVGIWSAAKWLWPLTGLARP